MDKVIQEQPIVPPDPPKVALDQYGNPKDPEDMTLKETVEYLRYRTNKET